MKKAKEKKVSLVEECAKKIAHIQSEPTTEKNAFAQLDEMAEKWYNDGVEDGGSTMEISNMITKLLKITKTANRQGYEPIAYLLMSLLIAIDQGPEDVQYLVDLVSAEYLEMFNTDLEDNELNMFNEDGTRTNFSDLGLDKI